MKAKKKGLNILLKSIHKRISVLLRHLTETPNKNKPKKKK